MAMEIPMDLIKQIQTSLRQEAKVGDHYSENLPLPSLQSFDDSITDPDSSPADLRCSHCKGKLLQGQKSFLCVFCGRRPLGDADPVTPPIKFRSTVGYRWFLHSLGLDGSEFVQPTTEEAKSNEGRNASPVVALLSDILDLEVQWSDERDIYSAPEFFSQQRGLSSLVSVDVDTRFPDGNSDSIPANFAGQFPPKEDVNVTESNSSGDPEKLRTVDNVQAGGWADFQFSEFRTANAEFEVSDHFVGSSRDFPPGKDEGSVPLGHSVASHSNSGFEDDKAHKFSMGETPQALKVENEDDSFDTWKEFESSKVVEDASGSSLKPNDKDTMFMEDTNRISFSDFGEGMQSQVAVSQPEKTIPSNQYVGSSCDLSAQMDEIFGYRKSSFNENGKDDNDLAMNSNNWLSNDLKSNQSEKFVGAAGIKNGEFEGKMDTSSSGKPDTISIAKEGHPFDVWNDFKSSPSSASGFKNPSHDISGAELKGEESGDLFSGSRVECQPVKSEVQPESSKPSESFSQDASVDLSSQMDAIFHPTLAERNTTGSVSSSYNNQFQDDQWNDLSRMTLQASQYDMSIDFKDSGTVGKEHIIPPMDWFANDQWPGSNSADIKNPVEDNDSTEVWNDFESLDPVGDASRNSLGNSDTKAVEKADKLLMDFDWMQNDQQMIGSKKQLDPISIGGNYDMSDEYKGYASSTNVQDTQGINHVNDPLGESKINFFSMNHNAQKNDVDSFPHQDSLFGTYDNQHVLSEGHSMSERDTAPQSSGNTEVEKDDLEALMLQTHDLSFMLESTLSVPPRIKQDGS